MSNETFNERWLLTGIIVSEAYIEKVLPHLDQILELMQVEELKPILQECTSYYHQYGRAPRKDIEGLYIHYLQRNKVKDSDAKTVFAILQRVNEDYCDGVNADFYWDETVTYFERLHEELYRDSSQPMQDFAPLHWVTDDDFDPDAWMEKYTVTQASVGKIKGQKVLLGIYGERQINILAAPPGANKTTMNTRYCAPELVELGYDVIVINADFRAAELEEFQRLADQYSYRLLSPYFGEAQGKSMDDIFDELENISKRNVDLTNRVYFFITLKKVADMMNKSSVKNKLEVFGRLATKHATVIIECNTNKYPDEKGNLIVEGPNDVISECDNLNYLHTINHGERHGEKGPFTVTFEPSDKVRALIGRRSFDISKWPAVVTPRDDYVDIKTMKESADREGRDRPVIDMVVAYLNENRYPRQQAIIKHCRAEMVQVDGKPASLATIGRILRAYDEREHPDMVNPHWTSRKAPSQDNATVYLLPSRLRGRRGNEAVVIAQRNRRNESDMS